MKKSSLVSSFALCAVLLLTATTLNLAVSSSTYAQESERKTKRTPALRARVYDQLARAQALADEGKVDEAIVALNGVEERSSSMNSYELAMMHNFFGFVYYNAEDYDNAIVRFEKVVEQDPIPESFEKSTLYSLSQLHMMRSNYDKTIEFLERWESLNEGEIPAKNLVLKAQAMYQKKDYQAASGYINQAIEQQENSELGFKVDENWYVLQRAVYYELKQPEKVKDVLVKLVKRFNEPKYWIQLAGMYGELGREEEQLALMEAAYQQGFVTKSSDIFNLAQLYYYHQVPYKAAELMKKAMDDGILEPNLRNMKFLSQSWTLAKENDRAVPTMVAAAKLSEDGELDAQLAQLYLNLEKYDLAISASQKALEKGGLRNEGTTHLVLGMAYYNKREFVKALDELAKAEAFQNSKGMAKQWAKYVETEKASSERLQAELSS